jgi:putative tryptophan/tyrosine transport system substrate-binding protein
MKRREFFALFTSVATCVLFGRSAVRAAHVPNIGVLVAGAPDPQLFWTTFQKAMHDLGYVEGQNLQFEYRSAGGDISRLKELASDLVRDNVDIIVAWQTPAVTAAKQATHSIPIVMASAGDPVGTGLVASLARPGGNVTGNAGVTAEMAGKSVEMIRQIIPSSTQVAALCNGPDPFSKPFLEHVQSGGKAAGVAIKPIILRSGDQLDAAFSTMSDEHVDAVIVQGSLATRRASQLAMDHHLPAVSSSRQFAQAGGLFSYSARLVDLYREAASYVDKIVKGANPADLPVAQPTTFELVLNRKTAKALGLKFPAQLLAVADEVIEAADSR